MIMQPTAMRTIEARRMGWDGHITSKVCVKYINV